MNKNNDFKELEKKMEIEEQPLQLNPYCMFLVSKYFNSIDDYINVEKTCKGYRQTMEQFKYNPIPLATQKERDMFQGIEVYHIYKTNTAVMNSIIIHDPKIQDVVVHEEPYHEDWIIYYNRLKEGQKKATEKK